MFYLVGGGGGPRLVPCFPRGPFCLCVSNPSCCFSLGPVCFLLFLRCSALQGTRRVVLQLKSKEEHNSSEWGKNELTEQATTQKTPQEPEPEPVWPPESCEVWQFIGELMEEPAKGSWLWMWALFGLPTVPRSLLLLIEDSALPVPVRSHLRSGVLLVLLVTLCTLQ